MIPQPRGDGEYFIDHARLLEDDLAILRDARYLTLWSVSLPPAFLSQLPRLELLDLRGGSAADLQMLDGVTGLGCLIVNQVRGLSDVTAVARLTRLRVLSLYGLPQVTSLPSFDALAALERLQLGQMRSLTSLAPALRAPALKELVLIRKIHVSSEDVAAINEHASLRGFSWFAEDVPNRLWVPVVEAVTLPPAEIARPETWYAERTSLGDA